MSSFPYLMFGVDEFTDVLQFEGKSDVMTSEWSDRAEMAIYALANKAELERVFNAPLLAVDSYLPNGYNVGFGLPDSGCTVVLAYNKNHPTMGVNFNFHAYPWAVYRSRCENNDGTQLNVSDYLRKIRSPLYKSRFSRIDFTADFFDWEIDIDAIYAAIKNGDCQVVDLHGAPRIKLNNIQMYGTAARGVTGLRVGSDGENTKGFLRVYDKKLEQIKTQGFRYDEAMSCNSWIRFEAVVKDEKAHKITAELLDGMSDEDIAVLAAKVITDKYRFVQDGEYMDFTKAMLNTLEGKNCPDLRVEYPRDLSLDKSLHYIVHDSGLFAFLNKLTAMYGEDAMPYALAFIEDYFKGKYYPLHKDNVDLHRWLNRVGSNKKDIVDFFGQYL